MTLTQPSNGPITEPATQPGTGPTAAATSRSGVGPGTIDRRGRVLRGDVGMATAEYAIATLAAAGFAGALMLILKGGEVHELLFGIIRSALSS